MSKKTETPRPIQCWAVWDERRGWLKDYMGAIMLFRRRADVSIYYNPVKVEVRVLSREARDE